MQRDEYHWERTVARPDQHAHLLKILSECVMDSPLTAVIAPDEANRRIFLEFILPRRLELFSEFSEVIVSKAHNNGGGKVIGHCAMMPPGRNQVSPSLVDMVKLGLWKMPVAVGLKTYTTFRTVVSALKIIENDIISKDEDLKSSTGYYTLEICAVCAELQGKGIGSKMIKQKLQKADQEKMPILIVSPNIKNHSFFKRLGFVVIDERVVEIGQNSFRNWALKRLPVALA